MTDDSVLNFFAQARFYKPMDPLANLSERLENLFKSKYEIEIKRIILQNMFTVASQQRNI